MLRALITIAALASAAPAHAQPTAPLFDGAALVGPPPAPGSARDAADRLGMRPQVTDARLAQARADQSTDPFAAFRPVMGADFAASRFPRTQTLLTAVLRGVGPAVNTAKDAHMRPRPFVDDATLARCDAPDAALAASTAYPSGHAAIGWAWALALAELAPARADAILQRGRDFGDSRVICGFHYPSDIDASRTIAAAAIARLHADADFRRDLEAARREIARAYAD